MGSIPHSLQYRFYICGARRLTDQNRIIANIYRSIYRPSIPPSQITPPYIIPRCPPPNSPNSLRQFNLFPITHTAKDPPPLTRIHLINPSNVRKSHQSAALSHRLPCGLIIRQNLQRCHPRQPPRSLRSELRRPRYGPGTLPLGPAPGRRGLDPASPSYSFGLS